MLVDEYALAASRICCAASARRIELSDERDLAKGLAIVFEDRAAPSRDTGTPGQARNRVFPYGLA